MLVSNRKASPEMAWLIDFMNKDFNDPRNAQVRSIEYSKFGTKTTIQDYSVEAKKVQNKARRLLSPLVQPKGLVEALIENMNLEIIFYNNLIKGPRLDNDVPGYIAHKEKINSYIKLSKAGIKRRAEEIKKGLQAIKLKSPREGLKELIEALNFWSLERQIHPQWALSDFKKGQKHKKKALIFDDKLFSVKKVFNPMTFEDIFFWNVAVCLERGEFNRLRRCQSALIQTEKDSVEVCSRFFFATHLNQKHCSDSCRKHFDVKVRAPERVRRFRARSKDSKPQSDKSEKI